MLTEYVINALSAVNSKSEICYSYFQPHWEAKASMAMHMSTGKRKWGTEIAAGLCQTEEMPGKNSTLKCFVIFLGRNVDRGFKLNVSIVCIVFDLVSKLLVIIMITSCTKEDSRTRVFAIISLFEINRLLLSNRKLQPQHGTFPCYSRYKFIIRRQYLTKLSC